MSVAAMTFCITITRGRDRAWVGDRGLWGRVLRGVYPAEVIQELLELGGELLTVGYASGLNAFEGHQEQRAEALCAPPVPLRRLERWVPLQPR